MTRMVFTLLLAFLIGCGSKSNSTQPSSGEKPEAKVELTPIPVKPSHEMDPAKHAIPPAPVSGNLGKTEIAAAEARVEGKNLIFQKPAAVPGENWRVAIELPAEPAREGSPSKMVLTPADTPMGTTWTVNVDFPKPLSLKQADGKTWKSLGGLGWSGGCAITLEWGHRENGKLPGKVYLCVPNIPDAHPDTPTSSVIAGTFIADCTRSATDPPGPEDVPYIRGAVHVLPEAPGAKLRAGYIGLLDDQTACLCAVDVDLDGGQSMRANHDKPRVSALHAGDGKKQPSFYEHSKLTPGRYLVFAGITNGATGWKWIEVKSRATMTADLIVNALATAAGGLEVTAPLEAAGKVRLLPASDPALPAIEEGLFEGFAVHMGFEQPIVNRKALFKNLAPGRYEVRAAKQSRTVEVVAGKTVELDFEKK